MFRVAAFALAVLAVPSFGQEDEFPAEAEGESDPAFARVVNPAFPASPPEATPVDLGPTIDRADLAPYFSQGKLAEAKAAFDQGQYSKAVTLLDGQADTPPIRFLRALAAMRAADWAFASKEFEALAGTWSPLRDRCLVHSGWAYEQLHDWAAAVRVFQQVRPTSRSSADAKIGLARSYRWLRESKKAIEVLNEYAERPAPPWGRDVGAEALLALADLYQAKEDAKNETATLQKLWSRHPMSKEAQKAEPRLGDLTTLPEDVMVTRAENLIDAHRNAQGVAIVEPMVPLMKAIPDALTCRAQFALGKGYRKLRQHQKAISTLAPLKKCKDPELKARALFTLAFSQGISAPTLAPGTYESIATSWPEHPVADDSLFFAADLHLRKGERDQAVERLIDVVDRYPAGDFAADALFKLFWIARTEGRVDDARMFLHEIEGRYAKNDDSHELERAQYWTGRLLEDELKKEEAASVYAALAAAHPATYYGLLARERAAELDPEHLETLLAKTKASDAASDPFPIHPGPLTSDPQFASAVELLRLGFGELVPMEILAIDRTQLPPESLRLMVLVLSLAGEQRSAHGLARLWLRRDLSGPITPATRAIWEIAYPNAFRDLIVTHCKSADELDPDLLQALMREESALDPKALSWAGALGLCQLMPATAAGVAMQLKLKQPRQAQLLEPDLNIQLGARYLSDLLYRMKGIKPFALASYNAGESAVARWRKENGDDDLAAWVEQVPLQETRGYVKRVLRSYNTYKLLYAPGELARTVSPLPERTPDKPEKKKPAAAPATSGSP
ncbi:MAG: transglycosylase SLT domain-containing protein [Myxococcaceae bacterium]